jgi:hypothetical protein
VVPHPKDTGLLLALVHLVPDLGRVARARGSEGVEVPHPRAGKEAVGIGERGRENLVMCIHRQCLLRRPRVVWNSLDTMETAFSFSFSFSGHTEKRRRHLCYCGNEQLPIPHEIVRNESISQVRFRFVD